METRICGWAWRAVSALAVAGALLGSPAKPAAALPVGGEALLAADAPIVKLVTSPLIGTIVTPSVTQGSPNTPLRMDFTKLFCADEQDDGFLNFHSEPYLVVFAADISGPTVRAIAVRSTIFSDTDSGETKFQNPPVQVWDYDGTGSPILDPDKLIFLGALMENDDDSARADTVRNRVKSDLFAKTIAYRANGLSRSQIISNLIFDMNVAINDAKGDDDRIGGVRELRLSLSEVENARRGFQVFKSLSHTDSGASYTTTFVLD